MSTPAPTRLFADFPAPTDAEWRKAAEESLEGAPFEKKLVTKTPEGIDLQPIYTRTSPTTLPAAESWPGLAPYTRGGSALGARASGWSIVQDVGARRPEAFNAALLADLNRGQNAVLLPLDSATRAGVDPDAAAAGQVGVDGLSIATLDHLQAALRGVDLTAVPVYVSAGLSALPVTAMLAAWLAEKGGKPASLQGAVLSDPIAEWVARGSLASGIDTALDAQALLTAWAAKSGSALRTVGVNASLWSDAGGSAVQELGFGLATAIAYLRALGQRGLDINTAASRVQFTLGLDSHFFTNIAKIRAARLIWARAVQAAGGNAEAQKLTIHARTGTWNKTVLDPHVNLLRTTSEAFSAVVAGCESIQVGAFDELYRQPDDLSRRLARNIQIILAEECQLGKVVDPSGGSYYVETLTQQLAAKAWALFQDVEGKGGMIAALTANVPQGVVAKVAAERLAAVEQRRDGVIGTNLHPNLKEKLPAIVADDAGFALERARALAAFRAAAGARGRQPLATLAKLDRKDAAGVFAALQEAFALGATLGEVVAALGGGAVSPAITPVLPKRRAAVFEKLRQRAEACLQRTGARPKAFLANLGPRKQFAARAEFSSGFFAAGGFETITNKGFETPEAAAQAAIESGAPIVVICSTDDTYPTLVPPLAAALKAAPKPPTIVLAGYPTAHVDALKAAGVDEFIHIRANCAQLLGALQDKIGL